MKKTLTESQLYDYIYNQVLTKLNEDAAVGAATPVDPIAGVAPAVPGADPMAGGAALSTNTGGQLNGTSSTAIDNIKKEADAGNEKAVDSFNPQGGEQASDNKQQGEAAASQQQSPSKAAAPQSVPQQQSISESELYDIIYKGIINELNSLW